MQQALVKVLGPLGIHRDQPGLGDLRPRSRDEHHLMAQLRQPAGQPDHHPFGAPVALDRQHSVVEEGNPHGSRKVIPGG